MMGAVGAVVGAPTSVALYALMDSMAPGTGVAVVAAKFAIDQLVGCVLWQAAYMCVNERYRRTFGEFAVGQWQQHQQQRIGAVAAAVPATATVAAC